MSKSMSAEEARRAVLEPSRLRLYEIAGGLDLAGPAFIGDVSVERVADMRNLHEPETWTRSTRKKPPSQPLFVPLASRLADDGRTYRTFLPEDLVGGDDARIRVLACASGNPAVRARLFEVLWMRFQHHADANEAIAARFALAPLADAEADWPGLVKNLGRLTHLAMQVNAKGRRDEFVAALDEARVRLLGCSRPFAFGVLADMVCNTLLESAAWRRGFTPEQRDAWATELKALATRYRADAHHGHDALIVLQAWHTRFGQAEAAKSCQREAVEQLSEVAAACDASMAPSFHEQALHTALRFGISDLGSGARLELMNSIKASFATFTQHSHAFDVPRELVATIDVVLAANRDVSGAIRQLSAMPGLLETDLQRLDADARAEPREASFLDFIPAVHVHPEGKITFRSDPAEARREHHLAFRISAHLLLVQALLHHFLAHTMAGFDDRTLIDALAEWPHLAPHRRDLLTLASARFAAHDWVSSGYIVTTLFEAVARDLLRAIGYHAMKVEPDGTQMDETLNSLLRNQQSRAVLGNGFCDLADFVLCNAATGWNLRNEVAHGTARPESFTPARVLLVWLLLVRLTCFTSSAPAVAADAGQPSPAQDDAPETDALQDDESGPPPSER